MIQDWVPDPLQKFWQDSNYYCTADFDSSVTHYHSDLSVTEMCGLTGAFFNIHFVNMINISDARETTGAVLRSWRKNGNSAVTLHRQKSPIPLKPFKTSLNRKFLHQNWRNTFLKKFIHAKILRYEQLNCFDRQK